MLSGITPNFDKRERPAAPDGGAKRRAPHQGADHPAIPVTIQETVETALACAAVGAQAMHLHVRDADQQHVLDAGLYREALQELGAAVPAMHFQITTEAVGRYTPEQMRRVAYDVMPPGISVGLQEMMPGLSAGRRRRMSGSTADAA